MEQQLTNFFDRLSLYNDSTEITEIKEKIPLLVKAIGIVTWKHTSKIF